MLDFRTHYTMKKTKTILAWVLIPILTLCNLALTTKTNEAGDPFFTTDFALNDKNEIVMTQKGHPRVDLFSPDGKTLLKSYPLSETPTGLAVLNNKAYITTFETKGELQIIDLNTGVVEAKIPTGSGACYPAFSPDKKHIYVCNQFANTVSEIDLATNKVVRTVNVVREPVSTVFSNDGKFLFVSNYLPAQRADADYVACSISVIDMKKFNKVKDILLANGSNALRGICITPDNKYIYASHNLGRYTVPTSQLQQGWMNTSAFSIVDVEDQKYMGSVVTDEPERGAAGIWDIVCDEDAIYTAHSGTHEVSVIDHKAMRDKFVKYPHKEVLDYDLNFLYNIRQRIPLEGNGPRKLLLRDGKLMSQTYFTDIFNTLDTETLEVSAVNMNPNRIESSSNTGERVFNDAVHCFQNWQSCNGCHPGDARIDAMNWDLMNDGVGNPKNCKSLLFSHVTPPSMISGIRETAEAAVVAGFRFIQFYELDPELAEHVNDYLKSLKPVPSPYLVDGKLSEKAKEGRKVFEKLKCGDCHNGPYFTDQKMHRIGQDIEFEKGWDTPTLREVWRTAPYLFDGRAATMEEVFSVHKHGIDQKVSKKDIEALTEYVNSL